MYPAGYFTLDFNFDFFNYAGIHRPVVLYTVPTFIHLTDVTVATDVTKELDSAAIYYQIQHTSSPSAIAEECRIEIQGGNGAWRSLREPSFLHFCNRHATCVSKSQTRIGP